MSEALRLEAERLSCILFGMTEGGGCNPDELWSDDFEAADGDVYVHRASEVLTQMSSELRRLHAVEQERDALQKRLMRVKAVAAARKRLRSWAFRELWATIAERDELKQQLEDATKLCAQDAQEHAAYAKRLNEERNGLVETLQFVERWVNHHGTKDCHSPEAILSVIQHYPPIKHITLTYSNGVLPATPDPYAERDALKAEVQKLRAEAEQQEPIKKSAIDFLPHDDCLRFVQRVLESSAPQKDRDDAARMVSDMRRSIYTAPKAPAGWQLVPSIEDAQAMGAKGGPVIEAERLAFEAWMKGHCWKIYGTWTGSQYLGESESGSNNGVDFRAMQTRLLWAAWRDRAALAAPKEPT